MTDSVSFFHWCDEQVCFFSKLFRFLAIRNACCQPRTLPRRKNFNSVRFLFDGQCISGRDAGTVTPRDLEMEDGDTIDVMVQQQGGC